VPVVFSGVFLLGNVERIIIIIIITDNVIEITECCIVFVTESSLYLPLKNFPVFHGTRRFNTVFMRALHWPLS
jgi:hypothetical protein